MSLLLDGHIGSANRDANGSGLPGRDEARPEIKQGNIKYDPFDQLSHDIVEALRANQKIETMKLYRQATGVGLKEAKTVWITIKNPSARPEG
jgi:ribosomal protein L7/L12